MGRLCGESSVRFSDTLAAPSCHMKYAVHIALLVELAVAQWVLSMRPQHSRKRTDADAQAGNGVKTEPGLLVYGLGHASSRCQAHPTTCVRCFPTRRPSPLFSMTSGIRRMLRSVVSGRTAAHHRPMTVEVPDIDAQLLNRLKERGASDFILQRFARHLSARPAGTPMPCPFCFGLGQHSELEDQTRIGDIYTVRCHRCGDQITLRLR